MKIYSLILNGFSFTVSAALFESLLFDLNSCGRIVTLDYNNSSVIYLFKPNDPNLHTFEFGLVVEV